MTRTEVLQQWIDTARGGRVKLAERVLTSEENALIVEILETVAADMLLASD